MDIKRFVGRKHHKISTDFITNAIYLKFRSGHNFKDLFFDIMSKCYTLVHSKENYMRRNKFLLDPKQYSRYGLNNLMQLPHRFLNSLYSTFLKKIEVI